MLTWSFTRNTTGDADELILCVANTTKMFGLIRMNIHVLHTGKCACCFHYYHTGNGIGWFTEVWLLSLGRGCAHQLHWWFVGTGVIDWWCEQFVREWFDLTFDPRVVCAECCSTCTGRILIYFMIFGIDGNLFSTLRNPWFQEWRQSHDEKWNWGNQELAILRESKCGESFHQAQSAAQASKAPFGLNIPLIFQDHSQNMHIAYGIIWLIDFNNVKSWHGVRVCACVCDLQNL